MKTTQELRDRAKKWRDRNLDRIRVYRGNRSRKTRIKDAMRKRAYNGRFVSMPLDDIVTYCDENSTCKWCGVELGFSVIPSLLSANLPFNEDNIVMECAGCRGARAAFLRDHDAFIKFLENISDLYKMKNKK